MPDLHEQEKSITISGPTEEDMAVSDPTCPQQANNQNYEEFLQNGPSFKDISGNVRLQTLHSHLIMCSNQRLQIMLSSI